MPNATWVAMVILWMAKSHSSGSRCLEQTAAMLSPCVTIKRGRSSRARVRRPILLRSPVVAHLGFNIICAPRSAMTIVGAFVLPLVIVGMIDASATRRFVVP